MIFAAPVPKCCLYLLVGNSQNPCHFTSLIYSSKVCSPFLSLLFLSFLLSSHTRFLILEVKAGSSDFPSWLQSLLVNEASRRLSATVPCGVAPEITIFIMRCQQGWRMMSLLSSSVWTPRCRRLANGTRRKSDRRGNVGAVGSLTVSHVFPSLPLTQTSAVTQAQRSATVTDITARDCCFLWS